MHAQLVRSRSLSVDELPASVQTTSADVLHSSTEQFTIDDARSLVALAHRRPVELPRRTCVIVTRSFTVEAQNALLKLFEEPPASTDFYIVVLPETTLLPTLQSRLLERDTKIVATQSEHIAEFLAGTYAKRLEMIADLAKAGEGSALQALLLASKEHVPITYQTPAFVRALALSTQYIGIRGASRKALLEHVALSVPENIAT